MRTKSILQGYERPAVRTLAAWTNEDERKKALTDSKNTGNRKYEDVPEQAQYNVEMIPSEI